MTEAKIKLHALWVHENFHRLVKTNANKRGQTMQEYISQRLMPVLLEDDMVD
jgi:hypothetical protein